MKKNFLFLLFFCLANFVFSQTPISIERIISELNWENCKESDVIATFKNNVSKRDNVETWEDNAVSYFILKKIKIGKSISDANIIVNKNNKKLLKLGGIILNNIDWSKGADAVSQEFEDYFSAFWGKEYNKSIEFDADFLDKKNVYKVIKCEWGDTYLNEKTSKGSFYLVEKVKTIVVAIEPK